MAWYYSLPADPRDKDIAFEIGRFYYGIRHYKKALEFYRDSSVNIGEHHVTYHNMGLCQYSMGGSPHHKPHLMGGSIFGRPCLKEV